MRSGTLDLSVGASRGENSETQAIGSVRYEQEFKRASLIADLTQTTSGNTDGDQFRTAAGGLRYLRPLSDLSQLDVNLRLTDIEQIAGGTEERLRSSATVAVNYNLTADWGLSTGYRYERHTTDGTLTLESNEVFATFSRSFDLRF